MADIVPGLLDQIKGLIEESHSNSEEIQKLTEKLALRQAEMGDAHDYAKEIGEILSEALKKTVRAEVLPDGRMYFNIASRVLEPNLKQAYSEASEYTGEVIQQSLEDQGYRVRSKTREANPDKIKGIVDRVSSEPDFNDIAWILGDTVVTFVERAVEDTIQDNAEFMMKARIPARVKRHSRGYCCEWCQSLQGEWEYPGVPREVWARHNHCDCIVEYFPVGGETAESVHTKKVRKTTRGERILDRMEQRLREKEERFNNTNPLSFSKAITNSKESIPEDMRWRVDAGSPEDYIEKGIKLHTTAGGSTVAVKASGDIVSVSRAGGDDVRGYQLLEMAVKNGGDRLDSYSGNHIFYTRNGFEPVSWCKFDPKWAPEDWEPEYGEEHIIFYKYTGQKTEETAREFMERIPASVDYDEAQALRDLNIKKKG